MRVGNVVVIPAGVGHKCESSSADFLVIGAYPNAASPDLIRSGEQNPESLRTAVANVPRPDRDPVYGTDGPLIEHWK